MNEYNVEQTAGVPASQKTPLVLSAMNRLYAEIAALEDAASALCQRLEPVSSEQNCVNSNKEGEEEKPGCQIADEIRERAQVIARIRKMINLATSSLEI